MTPQTSGLRKFENYVLRYLWFLQYSTNSENRCRNSDFDQVEEATLKKFRELRFSRIKVRELRSSRFLGFTVGTIYQISDLDFKNISSNKYGKYMLINVVFPLCKGGRNTK